MLKKFIKMQNKIFDELKQSILNAQTQIFQHVIKQLNDTIPT